MKKERIKKIESERVITSRGYGDTVWQSTYTKVTYRVYGKEFDHKDQALIFKNLKEKTLSLVKMGEIVKLRKELKSLSDEINIKKKVLGELEYIYDVQAKL